MSIKSIHQTIYHSRSRRLAIILMATAVYILLFFLLHPMLGSSLGAFVVLPVFLVSWLLGAWAGILSALLAFLLNSLLLNLSGETGYDIIFRAGGGPGMIVNLLLAGIVGYVSDLRRRLQLETASRVQLEERQQTVQQQLRNLADATNDAIWSWNLTSDQLSWGLGALALYGYDETMVETPIEWWQERLHPDDRQTVLDSLEQWLAQVDSFWSHEYRFRCADGRYATILDRGHVILGDDSRPARMVGAMMDISRQRRAEKALQRSEARWRSYFEDANDLLFTLDRNGRFTSINQTASAVLGYSVAELLELGPVQLVPPDEQPSAIQLLLRILNGEEIPQAEVDVLTKDGRRLTLEIRGRAIFEGERQVETFHIARDITERKQAERNLRQSEQRYRRLFAASERQAQELALLDQVRTALARELDLPSLFRTVVEAIADTFGYTLVSLYMVEDGRLKLHHQVGYDTVIEEIGLDEGVSSRVVHSGQPLLLANVRQDPDFLEAIEGIVSQIAVPLFSGDRVVGTLNVESTHDVRLTEADLQLMRALGEHVNLAIDRARLYTEMRESQERLRTVVANAPVILWALDDQGNITLLEGEVVRLLDIEPGSLIGQSVAKSFGHLVPELGQLIELSVDGHSSVGPIKVGDLTFDVRYAPVHDENGRVTGIIGVATNITERAQAEEALRQAQKLESLGVLAGGIAHDFNNLLVGILGQTSLALSKLPPESPARNHIEKSARAAERAADLTRQMLAYSGRGRFETRSIVLNNLIQENLHLFEVAMPKNVQFLPQLSDNLPPVEADPGQMQQVVMNLIINAAEAFDGYPGTIRVTTAVHSVEPDDDRLWQHTGQPIPPGPYAMLAVEDNGVGMDEATVTKIFDPFFTTKFTGRGLGLAAVLGIVRGHNGGLVVESTPGQGTTFTIFLPVAETPETAAPSTPAQPDCLEGVVLVVDDEAAVREAVTDILTASGLKVLEATDGRQALEIYRRQREQIAVVLLDLSMPGLSGMETLEALRRYDPDAPVVLTSGYDQSSVTLPNGDGPSVAFLQKPYDSTTLIRLVQNYVR